MIKLESLYKLLPRSLVDQKTGNPMRDLNVVLIISKFHKLVEVISLLKDKGFESETYKDGLAKLTTSYYDSHTKETLVINYYLSMDESTGLLVFFSDANKQIIRATLYKNFVEVVRGVYYAWINPIKFQELTSEILNTYKDSTIDFFITKRKPTYKSYARIRPYEERSINYHGSDGREALDEFKQVYGMLPTLIEFVIPGRIKFKIDVQGIFTFSGGDIQLLNKQVQLLIDEILNEKKILDQSKFEFIKIKTLKNKDFFVPDIKQWAIHFSKPIEYEDVSEILKDLAVDAHFIEIDNTVLKGSLFWSATLLDSEKNTLMSIKCNGNQLFVLPKGDESFDSFSRFFKFFAENIDEQAKMETV